MQITEQWKLCALSLHLSWTQFGCDNDAACLPFKDLTITSPNRTCARSWYYSVRFEWPGAAEQLVIFQVFLLSRYSLDGLELAPLDLFSQTHRGFCFAVQANSFAQLFWQREPCVGLVMDRSHYLISVKLTRKIKVWVLHGWGCFMCITDM